jgi:hypothetical protein
MARLLGHSNTAPPFKSASGGIDWDAYSCSWYTTDERTSRLYGSFTKTYHATREQAVTQRQGS